MRYISPLFTLAFTLIVGSGFAQSGVPDSCRLEIGTNLSGPVDSGSEWPFTDIMRYARTWGTQNVVWYGGGQNPWDSELAGTVPVDEQGYPLKVPFEAPGQDTSQIFFTVWANTESMLPGVYTCRYDGTGRIDFGFDGSVIEASPGLVRFNLDAGQGDILIMRILESMEGDHIRNIRIYMPGYADDGSDGPWCREWVEKLEPFKALRFMDWGYTNNQDASRWNERTRMDDYTYTQKTGVPYEWWIEACNTLKKDAWICIPHRADDAFIDSLAILFRDRLDPDLKLYVEYTNEYWNWIFSQAHYVNDSLDQSLPWPERYAPRLAQVMGRFSSHFQGSDTDRIIRVFATQHAWWDLGWRVMNQLESQGDLGLIDAVSIAGYMGIRTDSLAQLGATATAEDVIRFGRSLSFDPQEYAIRGWNEHAAMALRWDKQLLFYEGGQHFTPEPFGSEQPYGPALVAAQTHPGMYGLYNDLFEHLRTLTEEKMLFMNFSFIGPTSERYGSWGVLTHQFDQRPPYLEEAPKYQALLDNIPDCELGTGLESYDPASTLAPYPSPSGGSFAVSLPFLADQGNLMVSLVDLTGRTQAIQTNLSGSRIDITLQDPSPGIFILLIRTDSGIFSGKVFIHE